MIKLNGISRSFGRVTALTEVSFEIPEGSITGIIGPNGAGKSTIFNIITGYLKQDSGDFFLLGERNPPFEKRMKLISYMPENLKIYPELRTSEFVHFMSKTTGRSPDRFVEVLNLKHVWNRRIKNLSKGYAQRVKLFFALLPPKNILLLDEPFDGFDPIQLVEITDLLREENARGRTFVLSIHHLSHAEKICNYFVLLKEGKVIETGNLNELKNRYDASNLEEIFIRALS